MRPVHPPLPDRDLARALGLGDWVSNRGFPLREYCQTIDDALAILRRFHRPDDDADPEWNQVVPTLMEVLERHGALEDYVYDTEREVPTDATWWNIRRACAWAVLERYDAAVKAGEWGGP